MARKACSHENVAKLQRFDIYKLREVKRKGCPAFRSGRVYPDELLDWFEEERSRKEDAALNRDESKERLRIGGNNQQC